MGKGKLAHLLKCSERIVLVVSSREYFNIHAIKAEFCANSFWEDCSLRFVSFTSLYAFYSSFTQRMDFSSWAGLGVKQRGRGRVRGKSQPALLLEQPPQWQVWFAAWPFLHQNNASLNCQGDAFSAPSSSSRLSMYMHTGFSPSIHSLLEDNWRKSQRKEQLAGYTDGFRERSPRGV